MSEMSQKLPRRSPAGAAAIPPITDAKADVRRGRDGPEGDIPDRFVAAMVGSELDFEA